MGKVSYVVNMSLLLHILLLSACLISHSVQGNGIPSRAPKLEFFPVPPVVHGHQSNLIWYGLSGERNVTYWTSKLDSFLEEYTKPGGQNKMECDYNVPPEAGKVCNVNVSEWYPCTRQNNYNYHRGAPCIFLRLEKILGWKPNLYNDTNNLPAEMPLFLKNHIKTQGMINPSRLNNVWVSCEGENPADAENIGPVQYLVHLGFPGYYFPYENTEGYLSPLVAVFFERPIKGVIINIVCKAWASNLADGQVRGHGSAHFELLID